jgi:hypothetical protein
VEPIGAQRLPNLNLLNVRAEKSFGLGASQRLAVRLNIYNALNVNTVLSVIGQSGNAFARPTLITPPRIAEVGLTYTF